MRNEPLCRPAASLWQRDTTRPRSRCIAVRISVVDVNLTTRKSATRPRPWPAAVGVQQELGSYDLVTSFADVRYTDRHDFRHNGRRLELIDCDDGSGRRWSATDGRPLRHRRGAVRRRRRTGARQRLSPLPVSTPATGTPSGVRSHSRGEVCEPAAPSVSPRQIDVSRRRSNKCSAARYGYVRPYEANQNVHVKIDCVDEVMLQHGINKVRSSLFERAGFCVARESVVLRTLIEFASRSWNSGTDG